MKKIREYEHSIKSDWSFSVSVKAAQQYSHSAHTGVKKLREAILTAIIKYDIGS